MERTITYNRLALLADSVFCTLYMYNRHTSVVLSFFLYL